MYALGQKHSWYYTVVIAFGSPLRKLAASNKIDPSKDSSQNSHRMRDIDDMIAKIWGESRPTRRHGTPTLFQGYIFDECVTAPVQGRFGRTLPFCGYQK